MTQDAMKDLREYFDGRFDGVDRRFDRIDATMEHGFGVIRTHFSEVRECLDRASARTCERIDKHFDALRADLRIAREEG